MEEIINIAANFLKVIALLIVAVIILRIALIGYDPDDDDGPQIG